MATPATTSTKLAPLDTFRDYFERCKPALMKAIPKGMISPDRMIRMVLSECRKTPELLNCNSESVAACMMQAGFLGLEIGGPLGQSYLIPYKRQCTLQIGYRGLLNLAFRSGRVKLFNAHVVYENDAFHLSYGNSPSVQHSPPKRGERGAPIGCYAVVQMAGGVWDVEYMSAEQLNSHQKRYAATNKVWDDPLNRLEMWRKTLIRRLCKRLPVTVEIQRAVEIDETGELNEPQSFDPPALAEGELSPEPNGTDDGGGEGMEEWGKSGERPEGR